MSGHLQLQKLTVTEIEKTYQIRLIPHSMKFTRVQDNDKRRTNIQ